MNCAKKNKARCVNCPEVDITMVDTKRSMKMLVACKMKPEMKIDQFTRQPDWCPLKTEMQTPIELPKVPDETGVEYVN